MWRNRSRHARAFFVVGIGSGIVALGLIAVGAYASFAPQADTEPVQVGSDEEGAEPEESKPWFPFAAAEEADLDSIDELNVLLLGLDARKDEANPRCDAIHMFTLDLEDWDVTITSVPRGTYSYIPPGTYEEAQYYLANACAFAGLEYGIEQIEKVVGFEADHVVTVGFSQALGIFRKFDLPENDTLRWLRHRQSYQIGDPQRSRNQAVFMKDMILQHAGRFRSGLTLPFQYILYSMVDTDMDFSTGRALLKGFLEAEIDERPDDISLRMKPYHPVADYHLDVNNIHEQLQKLEDFIRPYVTEETLSRRTLEDVQDELEGYLVSRLTIYGTVEDVVDQQLWRQIEDSEMREALHFEFIKRYIAEPGMDDEQATQLVNDYIFEKESTGEDEYAEKGRALLEEGPLN